MVSLDLYAVAPVHTRLSLHTWYLGFSNRRLGLLRASARSYRWWHDTNLVDPASSHMLVSKIKPCMSQYKLLYGETANGSLKQL